MISNGIYAVENKFWLKPDVFRFIYNGINAVANHVMKKCHTPISFKLLQ